MRVAFVTPRARAIDGWGRYTVELAAAVQSIGLTPVLVTAEAAVDPAVSGFEHHPVLPPLFDGRYGTARRLIARPRVRAALATTDVVHGIAEPYLPLVALACTRRHALLQTAHGTWAVRPFTSFASRVIHIPALARVDLLVAQSRYTRDAMAAHVRLPPHVVLSGGVRPETFAAPSAAALPAFAREAPFVLVVGQVKPRKGIHVTLEAVARVRQDVPALHLVVVGPHDPASRYRTELQARAERLGMAGALHLTGEVDAATLVAWYQAATAFALLSIDDHGAFEGLGLVYLEAAAAGLPAIGTRESGAADAIVDGETGWLVPQGDAESAATAIRRLVTDVSGRARMAAAARRHAAALSWSHLAQALAERYDGLARARRASS